MKLKTISARTIPEAMAEVRQTLGKEAVIVSSLKMPSGGVQLVVATGKTPSDKEMAEALLNMSDSKPIDRMRAVLNAHRVPDLLTAELVSSVRSTSADISIILCEAIKNLFSFSAIVPQKTQRAFLLTGMPASGKTTALLKWALNAARQNMKVALVSLDNQKAGAVQGLERLANVLKMPLSIVEDLSQLAPIIQKYRQSADLVLIDSVGLNPWHATDMALLAQIGRACDGIEPVLTMPAGLDALEAGEVATQFARLGCTRLIATRMDVSGVYGNILNAAYTAKIALAYYGQGAMPTDELKPLTVQNLTQFLLQTSLVVQDQV